MKKLSAALMAVIVVFTLLFSIACVWGSASVDSPIATTEVKTTEAKTNEGKTNGGVYYYDSGADDYGTWGVIATRNYTRRHTSGGVAGDNQNLGGNSGSRVPVSYTDKSGNVIYRDQRDNPNSPRYTGDKVASSDKSGTSPDTAAERMNIVPVIFTVMLCGAAVVLVTRKNKQGE